MTDTTIAVSNAVKEQIRSIQNDGETFNGTLQRLVENHKTSGELWTEDEIRHMVRDEIRSMQR